MAPEPLLTRRTAPLLSDKLLHVDLPSEIPGADARCRVSMQRCKLYANRHYQGDMPDYLPAGLMEYVLNNVSKNSPPYHVTQDDVSTPLQRLEAEKITGHQSVRGRGGVIAVMYETHWTGLSGPSWERQMDLQLFRHELLLCWASTPNHHRQSCTTGTFSEQLQVILVAWIRLRYSRRMA